MDQDTHIIDGFGTVTCFSFNIPRIIEKVKEREKTTVNGKGSLHFGGFIDYYLCGGCHSGERGRIFKGDNFCPNCGREIDWTNN